ncbi:MAG: efflux RND transporter periplasmic adaptor subunit [Myxococcales bacterium]|nr:efflux RND transporter periplasmic adaptor subunit [Myxococcales bacterium]
MKFQQVITCRRCWAILPLLALLWAPLGCAKKSPPAAQPASVVVATAESKDMPIEIHTIGSVEPIQSATLRAQVGGYLARILFTEGQEVAAGQMLFQLDTRSLNAQREVNAATVEQTRLQLANAENQLRRGEDLFQQKFISQEDLDNLKTAALALRATLAAQTAALEKARLDLQFTSIRAPFAGRMSRWLVNQGELVQANGTALATINQLRPIDVQFSIPEKDLAAVRAALAGGEVPVLAVPSRDDGEPVAGRLIFIDNAIDSKTGSILLKARFDNDDERLWPGQYVDVTLQLGIRRGAVVVPSAAVQVGQQGEYVYVLDAESKAALRLVKTGPIHENETTIDEGVQAGETVVTDGQLRLVPGMKAEVRKPAAAPAEKKS